MKKENLNQLIQNTKIQSLPKGFFDEYRQYTKTNAKGNV